MNEPEELLAAVDLGSNSFHLKVAHWDGASLHQVDRLRERVRLAAGLQEDGQLKSKVAQRALECLERFGQRLKSVPNSKVRAVGTNTLRQLRDGGDFLRTAAKALGHSIEIISGHEEARLVYLGVQSDLPYSPGRRLVLDIGGGSTECALGESFEVLRGDSLYMGCVSYTLKHFPNGELKDGHFDRAVTAAALELQPVARHFLDLGWDEAFGSSGTVLAVENILLENQWSEGGLHLKGLKKLRRAMVECGRVDCLNLPGLQADRRPVLAGGVAILLALFQSLKFKKLQTSKAALREGLLYDLLGRMRHEDVRDRTIQSFGRRFRVDAAQASRVERTALHILKQVEKDWELPDPESRLYLSWAARLHEIGLSVAYTGYHRHGAYLVQHSHMPGFSKENQMVLANLIQNHRRRIELQELNGRSEGRRQYVLRLCALLRLAVRLNRTRTPLDVPRVDCKAKGPHLKLKLPEGWLESHPLTQEDLILEAERLAAAGLELRFQA
ncbi:MAG: Ppx/GppA family phosphatase [Planctomycetota bacterium]|nr:MAG: Ppx/GppA family phosphatase [Planctomycetota bacterium]